jgi:caffeoyl-CoA O-methyltransferase
MALALDSGGKIECTESDTDNVQRGQRWIEQAGMAERVHWNSGDALELITKLDDQYDLILNDVDKEQYPEALRRAWPKVRRGGVLITDNALWHGRVAHESPPGESTRGVLQINQAAYALPDALVTILPLRDGLLLALKT